MRRSLVFFTIPILLTGLINVPLAVLLSSPPRLPFGRRQRPLSGAAAALHTWPDSTPHVQPWPSIDNLEIVASLGHRRILAHAIAGSSMTHSMQTDLYGWPLPVLRETNR